MKLWDCLSEEDKEKLIQYQKEQFGMKLIIPKRDKRAIHCEVKLKEEDGQGREG